MRSTGERRTLERGSQVLNEERRTRSTLTVSGVARRAQARIVGSSPGWRATPVSEKAGVTFSASELPVVPTPDGGLRRRPFLAALASVVPGTQGAEVRLVVVVARDDVVDFRRGFLATLPVLVSLGAATFVAPQDATPDLRPVRWEPLPAIGP
jgi:hypothetical protein